MIVEFLLTQGALFLILIAASSKYGFFPRYMNNIALARMNPNYMTENCTIGEMELIVSAPNQIPESVFHNNLNFSYFIFDNFIHFPARHCFLNVQGAVVLVAHCLWLILGLQIIGTGLVCLYNFGDFVFNALFFIAIYLYYSVYRNHYNEHIISGLFRNDKWPVLFFYVVCFSWKNWHLIFTTCTRATASRVVSPRALATQTISSRFRAFFPRTLSSRTNSRPSRVLSPRVLAIRAVSIDDPAVLIATGSASPVVSAVFAPRVSFTRRIKSFIFWLFRFSLDFLRATPAENEASMARYPKKLLWLNPVCAGMIFAFNTSDGSSNGQNLMHLIAVALYGITSLLNSKNYMNYVHHTPFMSFMIFGMLVFNVLNYYMRANKAYYASSLTALTEDFVHAPPAFIHMAKMCFVSELVIFAASL